MRIAFLTATDPLDRGSWSGTPYHMLKALERRGVDMFPLGPLRTPVKQWLRAYGRARNTIGGRKYIHGHSPTFAMSCARAAERSLSGGGFDAVLAPAASACVAYLATDLPIVYVTDAPFRLMVDYYPDFSNLCAASLRGGERIESLALERSAAVCVPTEWAARSAERDYGVDRGRLHVVPFGVNLEPGPPRERARTGRSGGRLELLFVGKQWVRKGGDIAAGAVRALNARGVDARLTVCGCVPPTGACPEGTRVMPFIDKNTAAGRAEMEFLYASSDLLLLPTRAECFGMVITEANSFGVPALVAATGGVPEVVVDGRNGRVLPQSARGDVYAEVVLNMVSDERGYRRLCETSRLECEARLNWDVWAVEVIRIVSGVCAAR